MKRPSFQFYPADWLRDTGLRTCSVGARGLWMDMLCYMHEGNPYGVLKVGNKVILPPNLAVMVGATLQEVEGWLHELELADVFDRGEDNEIMSRRMIRDEIIRNARASGGKMGGNPNLKTKKVNLTPNLVLENEVNQKPTPSSSSSSSSSSKNTQPSYDETFDFCQKNGLARIDAEYMQDKWLETGFKNNGKPIKDWQAQIRNWKRMSYLPSTKQKPPIRSIHEPQKLRGLHD